ncbi:MAG: (2Fe-2S)-binding protein [Candidatus Eremiobacteraeota bacterium]|nr:(2Fe-2S)-binding protein [Candidatus Eremiobacteraeota bacterium]
MSSAVTWKRHTKRRRSPPKLETPLKLRVNRKSVEVDAAAGAPLLYVLRNDLDLKGSRFGCGESACGACMVLIDGRPAFSCDTPLWFAEGKEVTTIEGVLETPEGRALSASFVDEQAAQCGYCIAGIIVAAAALLRENPRPDRATIAAALEKNLCRCGTHARILKAVERAATRGEGSPP